MFAQVANLTILIICLPAALLLTGEKQVTVDATIAVDVEAAVKRHHSHCLLFLLKRGGNLENVKKVL